MPTGFDVETGGDLSEKLLGFVQRIGDYLRKKRKEENRGPGLPITGAELMAWAMTHHHFRLSGSDVRAMVNYLRRNKWPIGSNAGGYFYAVNNSELDHTRLHLAERISAIRKAYDGLCNCQFSDGQELF